MRLTLKTLYAAGELSGTELSRRLGVLFAVIEPTLEFLKLQRQCEVVAGALVGAASYRYRITGEGRSVANQFLEQDQYIGPTPVPIAQYRRYMTDLQRATRSAVSPMSVRAVFSHLVLSDTVLDEVGAAVRNGRSLFIYGPPGNGKTVIAHGIQRLLSGDVFIPYALEVEGAIIRVFDPVNHAQRPAPDDDGTLRLAISPAPLDARWAVCARPIVKVGGEMTLESFDLTYDPRLGYYRAPLQLIANGGVLIIDDFGRQRCSPADLLNRWMVPLESSLDYLMLRSGQKFEIPFHAFVVFATNLRPSDLVDEAFMRRVPFKVLADNPTPDMYVRIFAQQCAEFGLAFDQGLPESLLDNFYRTRRITPRGCHPRDLINQAVSIADYSGQPRVLTPALLEVACANYFVTDQKPSEPTHQQ
ncbi:MAG: ATP-binding protein [Vicinamibacterales bacterium]